MRETTADPLAAITSAAVVRDEAENRLRELVAKTYTEKQGGSLPGVTISDIAEAAGVTRQTVHRWAAGLDATGARRPYRSASAAMDEALLALLDIGAGPTHELTAGLRTRDESAKARRVQLGAANVPAGVQVPEELRAIIGAGTQAAHDVQSGGRR